jgi:hypothetical protein
LSRCRGSVEVLNPVELASWCSASWCIVIVPWNQESWIPEESTSNSRTMILPSAKNFVRPGHSRGRNLSDPLIRQRLAVEDCDWFAVADLHDSRHLIREPHINFRGKISRQSKNKDNARLSCYLQFNSFYLISTKSIRYSQSTTMGFGVLEGWTLLAEFVLTFV